MADVVDEPCGEDDPAAGQDPGQLPRCVQGAHRDGKCDPGCEPARDADPAERRRCPFVPALSRGQRDEPGGGGGANEGPEGERRDRQGGDRDGRFHGAVKRSGRSVRFPFVFVGWTTAANFVSRGRRPVHP